MHYNYPSGIWPNVGDGFLVDWLSGCILENSFWNTNVISCNLDGWLGLLSMFLFVLLCSKFLLMVSSGLDNRLKFTFEYQLEFWGTLIGNLFQLPPRVSATHCLCNSGTS